MNLSLFIGYRHIVLTHLTGAYWVIQGFTSLPDPRIQLVIIVYINFCGRFELLTAKIIKRRLHEDTTGLTKTIAGIDEILFHTKIIRMKRRRTVYLSILKPNVSSTLGSAGINDAGEAMSWRHACPAMDVLHGSADVVNLHIRQFLTRLRFNKRPSRSGRKRCVSGTVNKKLNACPNSP